MNAAVTSALNPMHAAAPTQPDEEPARRQVPEPATRSVRGAAEVCRAAGTEQTDQQLLGRYGAGDQGAFDALYARHRGSLRRFVAKLTQDRDEADEVFQEVWMAVIRGRQHYRPTARFTTYLFAIAHHRLQDRWRRRGRHPAVEDTPAVDELIDESAPAAEQWVHNIELHRALSAAIDRLAPDQRAVFLLKAEANLSLEEIAAVTGTSFEATKSRMRYAVARLRAQLGSWK
ncbi:MAG TPA: sigma-70 family RNA polymerase sigma factor [Steroidobacteraceae bacterium]|jgi:RNA polymerase sigma-70 factor (ECF subfamily)|nr:sigma-70 family RNA polymerase sigma factor [Steroidobacteraceae bacterium]